MNRGQFDGGTWWFFVAGVVALVILGLTLSVPGGVPGTEELQEAEEETITPDYNTWHLVAATVTAGIIAAALSVLVSVPKRMAGGENNE